MSLIILILPSPESCQSLDDGVSLKQQIIQLCQPGCCKEAIPLAEKTPAIWVKRVDPGHPDVATSLKNLAVLYLALRDYESAEPLNKLDF